MKTGHLIIAFSVLLALSCGPRDGEHILTLLTTDDVHGAFFDSSYVGAGTRHSLFAIKHLADSVREAQGGDNVILLDAGDCVQGDNAAYYYNYVDTVSRHIYPRMAKYMAYDAIVVGNHDIEAGHSVYDRLAGDLRRAGIAFLAGNAFRTDNGESYFPLYTVLKRSGLKVLVMGYTNPNMRAWLDSEVLKGFEFKSLIPLVQHDVDSLRAKEKPDVVIVAVHSGKGAGDGSSLENQGLDLYNTLSGVDFLVCAHDHCQFVACNDSLAFLNAGTKCRYLAEGKLSLTVKKRKIIRKELSARLIKVPKAGVDSEMRDAFRKEYLAVKDFTTRSIGKLEMEIRTRDAYRGMNDYINLIHTVQLEASGADISMAAPLTYNGIIASGELIFNDLFTIYPYENRLFALKMKGSEIKDFLEYSYGLWLADAGSGHVLRIAPGRDDRYLQKGWSFKERPYNFDSAAGLNYTVDVSKASGDRISISGMADGRAFEADAVYTVVMTSYRASGGGGAIIDGAGIPKGELDSRIIGRYNEIRNLLHRFIMEHPKIDSGAICDKSLLGEWKFVPEEQAREGIEKDMALLFGSR